MTFEEKNDELAQLISDLLNAWEELAQAGQQQLLEQWQASFGFQLNLYRELAVRLKTEVEEYD